jgi:hypothetical protein
VGGLNVLARLFAKLIKILVIPFKEAERKMAAFQIHGISKA